MKDHEEDPLLKELLGGEELSGFRQDSLKRGLDAVRRARRRRRVVRIGLAAVPVLLAAALLLRPSPQRQKEPVSVTAVSVPAAQPSRNQPAAIRYIGDDELFAMFPGRSIALVGAPGHQELVFLDQPTEKDSAQGL